MGWKERTGDDSLLDMVRKGLGKVRRDREVGDDGK
jgi:hypothetical protein